MGKDASLAPVTVIEAADKLSPEGYEDGIVMQAGPTGGGELTMQAELSSRSLVTWRLLSLVKDKVNQ